MSSLEVLLFCNVLCQVVKQARNMCQDGHMFTWSNWEETVNWRCSFSEAVAHAVCIKVGGISLAA